MDNLRKHKEVEAPKPETGKETKSLTSTVVPDEGYVYTGENNYEAPKPDPWTEETK